MRWFLAYSVLFMVLFKNKFFDQIIAAIGALLTHSAPYENAPRVLAPSPNALNVIVE